MILPNLSTDELKLTYYVTKLLMIHANNPDHAITAEKICTWINHKIDSKKLSFQKYITAPRMRKIISYLRQMDNDIIISANGKGYFIVNDIEEIFRHITSMRERANVILAAADALEKKLLKRRNRKINI